MTEPQQASITEHGPIPFIVANFSQQVFGALGATPLGSVGALSKSNQMPCNQSLGTVPPPKVCVGVDPTTGAGRQESQPITSNVCAAECLGFGFIFEKISSAWMFIVGVGFYFPTSKGDFFICFAAWCFVVGFVWLWSNEMGKCRRFNFSLCKEADRRGNLNCAKCR